jgi:hypothetical protein
MSTPTRNYAAANLRVSDADRDAVLAELSEHFQAGRLTSEELDERTGRALSARTGQDLATIMADLPAPAEALSRQPSRRGPGGFRFPVVLIVIAAAIIGLSVTGHHGGDGLVLLIPIALLIARRMARRSRRRTSVGEDWQA